MATTDDFTFQINTNALPCLVNSPPMWRPRSSSEISTFERDEALISTSEISTYEKEEVLISTSEISSYEKEEVLISTSEISTYEREEEVLISCVEKGVSDENGEEKMDMLWEDLNEEFSIRCGSDLNTGDSSGRFVKFGCVRGSAIVKKPRTVSFLNVLKRLFLLHNFQLSLKKRNCDPKIRV